MVGQQRDGSFRASDGCTIAYTLHSSGRAGVPRFVLIHSLALDRSIWDGVVAQLEDEADLLAYDCRGHGRSERRAGVYTPELFARDLSDLITHVGWDKAVIAGCSMGGCAALGFAARYAPRTRALALIDTTAWYGEQAPTQFRQRAANAKNKGMASLIDFQLSRWFTDPFRERNPAVLEHLTQIFVSSDLDCYAASCAMLGDSDLRPQLSALKMPTAIAVGEEDYATPPAMAQQLHEAIPQSTFKILSPGRHLTPIERPDAIAQELRALAARA